MFCFGSPTGRKLDRIYDALAFFQHKVFERFHKMSVELDRLTAEVSETKTAVDSAIALIGGLADAIRAIATDPAALNALADELDAQQAAIAAAVAANPVP